MQNQEEDVKQEVAGEQPDNERGEEETPELMLDAPDDEAAHNDEGVRHTPSEPATVLAKPDPCPDIDEATKRSVRQAHENLAHPARDAFIRMLRLGGAKADAITHAKHWQCPVCLQTAAPHLWPAMTRSKQAYDFDETVSADLLATNDANWQSHNVLSLARCGWRYHVAVIAKQKDSKTVTKTFLRC